MSEKIGIRLEEKNKFILHTGMTKLSAYEQTPAFDSMMRAKHKYALVDFIEKHFDKDICIPNPRIQELTYSTALIILTPEELKEIIKDFYLMGKGEKDHIESIEVEIK